jgi:hypothetical protein
LKRQMCQDLAGLEFAQCEHKVSSVKSMESVVPSGSDEGVAAQAIQK